MKKKLIAVFVMTSLYTLIRYVYLGPVPPDQIPAYLANKSISMLVVVTLLLTAYAAFRKDHARARTWGSITFYGAMFHILLSFAVLSKAYYPLFFDGEKLSLIGGMVVLMGASAVYCFWRIRDDGSRYSRPILQIMSGVFLAAHLVFRGWPGWFHPSRWHGGLPPISLLCFAMAVVAIVLFSRTDRQARN